MRPELPMIWAAVNRLFPRTAMLSTEGGPLSWAASGVRELMTKKRAAAMERNRRIGRLRGECAGLPNGSPAPASRLGSGQRPEDQSFTVGRHIDFDLVSAAELSHENL